MVSLLFSLKRSYVILLLEHWIKVFLFPSGSNYSQPPVPRQNSDLQQTLNFPLYSLSFLHD